MWACGSRVVFSRAKRTRSSSASSGVTHRSIPPKWSGSLTLPVSLPVSWTRAGDVNIAPPPSIVDSDATGRSRFMSHAAHAAARAAAGV
jgi:hypothetical protein